MKPQEQEFYALEGKIKRTVYAIVMNDLITRYSTLDESQVKYLTKKVKTAIEDAVENSIEFMEENGMIRNTRKKKKSAKKRGK